MHVHAMGEPARARASYASRSASPSSSPQTSRRGPPPARTGREIFNFPPWMQIVGQTGVVNGPTYKYTMGRKDLTVMAMGAEMTAAIGLNSWASFTGTPDAPVTRTPPAVPRACLRMLVSASCTMR